MEFLLDILIDAGKDTLIIVPFLFVTYLAMEWIEHKTSARAEEGIRKAGAAGPAIGAVLGIVPQCGFSAAASTFYAGRVITLGTLFAVFLSTSDEMLPIFLAEAVPVTTILAILGAKLAIGMVCGFVIDFVLRTLERQAEGFRIHELCEEADCYCEEHCAEEEIDHHTAHDHDHCAHEHGAGSIVMSAVKHTVQVTIFIFVISLVLDALIEGVGGEEALGAILAQNEILSIFVSALVGLIPNCAASVAIAQLYVEGVLGAGAMMSGLLVASGVGLLVLVRTNKSPKENLVIIAGLWAIGSVFGLVIQLLGF